MTDHATANHKQMLGEILVQHGLITNEMLTEALRHQQQVGGQIGSILIELGYISTETLMDFLSRHFGVPAIDLFKIDIPAEVLKVLPLEKIKQYKALPLKIDDKLSIAMVNPDDRVALSDIEFIIGKKISPVVIPSMQLDAALKNIGSGKPAGLRGGDLMRPGAEASVETNTAELRMLLKQVKQSNASDLQLTAGVPPSLRLSAELKRMNLLALTPEDMDSYSRALLGPEQMARFETANDLDFSFTDKEYGRYRANIYRQRSSVSITMRRIPDIIPSLAELGLPEDLESFALKTQGLILISGPAGHGKSTTMAALVDIINKKRKCNIITLEDPVEYLFKHKNSNVNQREIGADTTSFHEGLKHIFRQDPDVIVIGEMRDPESFRIALQAAETGHLVLSTLHSRNATSTIERVIDMFPAEEQAQIRTQLAETLLLVLSQRLLMNKERQGLVLAYERLVNSFKIKNFIRDGRTHQIRTQMQLPVEEYSSLDVSIIRLALNDLITVEEGEKHADDLSFYHDGIKGKAGK